MTIMCDCYYLSHNLFTADEGEYFCINHCQSNIASIPDEHHFLQAIKTINDSLETFYVTNNVWIGLRYNSSSSTFKWIDDTVFSFGSNVTGHIYPWASEANIATDECVHINTALRWESTGCNTQKHVLCNHCNGILNKYILPQTTSDYIDDAIAWCKNQLYPSTLSSFHNQRDFEELRTLCKTINTVNDPRDCWIGLYSTNDSDWSGAKFYDNTTFDFGTNLSGTYPWSEATPITSISY